MNEAPPRRVRRRPEQSFWQSYADLAMGMMAVFALAVVLLSWFQAQERRALDVERQEFSQQLLLLMDKAHQMVEAQDKAEAWVRKLFEEDNCNLALSADGRLELRRSAEADLAVGSTAGLYDPGVSRMSARGEAALKSCQANFLRLAYCLSPSSTESDGTTTATGARRRELCLGGSSVTEDAAIRQLQAGIEALSLEGNTDRIPIHRLPMPPIESVGEDRLELEAKPRLFARNAYLGAERARQALGHLLGLVQGSDDDTRDALEVTMNRVRIESPSFGRYQAGPEEARTVGCGDEADCGAARNLSLRLRWRKEVLRRPYEGIRRQFCEMLGKDSPLARAARAAGDDLPKRRASLACRGIEGS